MSHKIWERIEELMRAKDLDMPALATKAGITRQTLYNLKQNGSGNTKTIQAIAGALGVGPGYLMG